MLIDSHCHLDAPEFDGGRDAVLLRARDAGVDAMLVPAVSANNFQAVAQMAAADPSICYTLGIHPMYVDDAAEADLERLATAVDGAMRDPRFVGIGEIGLDHFVPGLDRARQQYFFERQLEIARDRRLPVVLHVRRAQDAILKQLRRYKLPGGIAHAFNGSEQQAKVFLDMGFVLGFGGAMTFTRALQIRRLAATLPDTSFVLETDSPDIPPAWLIDQANEPAQLPGIADCLAQLRGWDRAACIALTGRNFQRVMTRFQPPVR